jgi:hypothetical protein
MNLPTAHIERIGDLGYTEAEARFLYIVALFSGYFTLGQFRLFTRTSFGKRSSSFAQKLLKNGHATVRDYMRRGLTFHLFSRTIYGPIEKDNLRNRKRHSFDFIRTRLVLLDFILANQELAYFETEQDKVTFFCEKLGISRDFLPAKLYQGVSPTQCTIRYFVDKFPLFLSAPLSGFPPVVTFSYVDAGRDGPSRFASHLAAYQGLFRQLDSFRFIYIATKAAYFRRAEERFRSLVARPLESDLCSRGAPVLRYSKEVGERRIHHPCHEGPRTPQRGATAFSRREVREPLPELVLRRDRRGETPDGVRTKEARTGGLFQQLSGAAARVLVRCRAARR